MKLATDHVKVRVPATSANLGPGFDALGLALDYHDELEVWALASSDVHVDITGEGAGEVPGDERHLVVKTIRRALDHVGAPQVGLHLKATNAIPHGRGMGSSAAAVVAGLMTARALINDPDALNNDVILNLATQLEGHPDNAAPAILGGATVAWMNDHEHPAAASLIVHKDIEPTVIVPTVKLSTHRARGVLPPAVPHSSGSFNAGRAALLVHALANDPSLLFDATQDKLHQPYRAAVMEQTWAVVTGLRARGFAATVSGAGPTVLVLDRTENRQAVAAALDEVFAQDPQATAVRDNFGNQSTVAWRVLTPGIDRLGATYQQL